MTRIGRIGVVLCGVGLFLLLIPVVLHLIAFPISSQSNNHGANVEFALNRSLQLLPTDCVTATWRATHIQAIYLNDEGRIGEDQQTSCGITTFQLRVQYQGGAEETFTLSSTVLLETPIGQFLILSGIGLLFAAGIIATRHRHRAILKQVALIVGFTIFGVILTLTLLEIFFRVFMADAAGPVTYTTTRYFFYPDEKLGWHLMPDTDFVWTGKCREFKTTLSINPYGFRGENWQIEKPDGITRIAFLGDSFVEAAQMTNDETPSQVLQHHLDAAYGNDIFEVMNFGVSAYSIGQYLVNYEANVRQFQPDYVVVLVSLIQAQRTPEKALAASVPYATRPSFYYDETVQIVSLGITEEDYTLYSDYYATFRTDNFVEDRGLYLFNWWGRRDCQPNKKREFPAYRKPVSPQDEMLIKLNLDVIGQLNDAVRADGGQVVIVDALEYFGASYGTEAQPLMTMIQAYSAAHEIGYIDLGTRLAAETDPVIFYYDLHFNQLGYARFGEAVFAWLQSQVTIP